MINFQTVRNRSVRVFIRPAVGQTGARLFWTESSVSLALPEADPEPTWAEFWPCHRDRPVLIDARPEALVLGQNWAPPALARTKALASSRAWRREDGAASSARPWFIRHRVGVGSTRGASHRTEPSPSLFAFTGLKRRAALFTETSNLSGSHVVCSFSADAVVRGAAGVQAPSRLAYFTAIRNKAATLS